jgi:hypothetical protein
MTTRYCETCQKNVEIVEIGWAIRDPATGNITEVTNEQFAEQSSGGGGYYPKQPESYFFKPWTDSCKYWVRKVKCPSGHIFFVLPW